MAPVDPARIDEVRRRIEAAARRAGRDPQEVRLVAVTKTLPSGAIPALATLGIADIGENRILQGLDRRRAVPVPFRWHMIGHVQTNKIAKMLEWADVLHSLDRAALAEELERRLAVSGRRLPCYVQVNVSGEATKGGFRPEEVVPAVAAIRARAPHLVLEGLMTMAPESGDARPHFRKLRGLAEQCGLAGLSMGMSRDFESAIEEGATVVRVGSALF